uniref:Uncharacterized protein n=2 Tax=Hemiselmis andersenii TaxID=464988 RepID=A0A7S0XNZ7_HEMAN|mmetsp:Transcript_13297/g.31013  ORF Transcript_13297/g.31013 Transcript_13297/m.31013 type:complete len:158 (+) Transcript_13297:137-610(+)
MGVWLLLSPLDEVGGLLEASGACGKAVLGPLREMRNELAQVRKEAESNNAPLTIHKLPPVAIKQYNPRFDESFDPTRDMDPDRERAERSKLKRQHKKELKGTVRELRKDNQFLEHHRAATVKAQRAARDERGKAIETFLQQQQFEAKIGGGKKKKKK